MFLKLDKNDLKLLISLLLVGMAKYLVVKLLTALAPLPPVHTIPLREDRLYCH